MSCITTLPALREIYAAVNPRSALKELPQLDVHAKRLISLSPFVVMASYGADGRADTSPHEVFYGLPLKPIKLLTDALRT